MQAGGGTYGGHVVSSTGLIEVEGKQVKCLELDREGAGEAKSAAKKAGTSLYFAVGCGTRSEVRVEGMWSLVQTFDKSSGEDFLPARP